MKSIGTTSLIIFSIWITVNAISDISIPVTAFEYDLFRWPQATPQCDAFLRGLNYENADHNPQNSLRTDCERFRRALACYESFYSSLNLNTENGRETKKDLDDHNIDHLKSQCANIH
ncbi:hypothetical protein I4U23_023827 [Adineta vaga]|nr:hypothetical protein I4U23_023827 [Adineta vaga]